MPQRLQKLAARVTWVLAALLFATSSTAAQVTRYRVDSTSRVRIGAVDGAEELLFARVTGAARLSTGAIVVANSESREVRWFSPTGAFVRAVGRMGGGPGEFRDLRRLLVLRGDSVLVEDGLASRMTLFDPAGDLVRSWQIGAAGTFVTPPPLGRLSDGTFIAMSHRDTGSTVGHKRYLDTFIRYRDGELIDTVAKLLGGETFTVVCGTQSQPGVCNMGVPYGTRTMAAVTGDHLFFGTGERYELLRIDLKSGRTDTLRRNEPAVPLDAARREYFVDSLTSQMPAQRRDIVRARFATAPARRTLPYFQELIADDEDRLWLARPVVRDAKQRAWDVLDLRGRLVAEVDLPAQLEVFSIRHGHVTGVARDAEGVEFVEVYRLRR